MMKQRGAKKTCVGPGPEEGALCCRVILARSLCPAHLKQLERAGGKHAKLRVLREDRSDRLEARGRISPEAAALVSRYGKAELVREGKRRADALYRGTQLVLEAFGRGDLVWREGSAPASVMPRSKRPTQRD